MRKLIGGIGAFFLIVVVALTLFAPPGVAADFIVYVGSRVGAVAANLFGRIPHDTTGGIA